MENRIDELRELLKEKESHIDSELDRKKVANLKFLLKHDDIFFKLDSNVAIGILQFLGIPDNEIYDYYLSLISADNFHRLK